MLAYTIGHAGAFIPTPGGVGGTDGGLIGMFAAFGAPLGLATAGLLSYRVFQLGLPTVLGAVSLIRIRTVLRSGGVQSGERRPRARLTVSPTQARLDDQASPTARARSFSTVLKLRAVAVTPSRFSESALARRESRMPSGVHR